jgi:hypothetical protein
MPMMVIDWKSWNTASWNACGMCFISTPRMLSGPGALWLGSSLRASLKTTGVSLPMIMCWGGEEVPRIALIQGNTPLGSTLGSGEREAVSIFYTIAIASAGLFVMSPVSGSRRTMRCWVLSPCVLEVRSEADLRIDLSASLGFFTNTAKRAEP